MTDTQLSELPPDHDYEGDDHGDDEEGDQIRGEPVVLLALVENELEGAEGEAEETEAEQIELHPPLLGFFDLLFDPWRIFDDARGEEEGKDTDGDVEEEDPAPVEVVGDIAAESGADGRGHDNCEAVHCKGLPTFFRWEGVGEDRLLGGGEAAAADALEDSEEDKQG